MPDENAKSVNNQALNAALGDTIQASACLKYLERDFNVDWLCSPSSIPIIEHNPRISRIIRYTPDSIPLDRLDEYYKFLSTDYDRTVVLSGSVEGQYLKAYPHPDYYWCMAKRRKNTDGNFIEEQIRTCGYTPEGGDVGELYFGSEDVVTAKNIRRELKNKWIIMWALAGSSIQKGYLHLQRVMEAVFKAIPESVLFLIGSKEEALRLSWADPRVINYGLENKRYMTSFALAKFADLVVGPETALLNAAGCFDTPKIAMMTHSSIKNLCATWRNDFSLQAKCWCSPCYYLHKYTHIWKNVCTLDKYSWHKYGKAIPACTAEGFPPQYVFDRIMEVYNTRKERK